MRRLAVSFCLVLALSFFLAGCAKPEEKTVVTIDGLKLTAAEMECYLAAAAQSLLDIPPEDELRALALSIAVNYRALESHAAELKLSLTADEQKEIDARLQADIAGMGGEEDYRSHLQEQHLTEKFYRYYFYEIPVIQEKLFHGLFGEGGELHPGDEDVRAYYAHSYFNVEYLLLSNIDDMGEPLMGEALEAQRETARGFHARAQAGEELADISLEDYSPAYPTSLGELGEEFDAVMQTLTVGQVGELVENDYGFYIVKRQPDDPAFYEENIDSLRFSYCWYRFSEVMSEWEQAAVVETTPEFDELSIEFSSADA